MKELIFLADRKTLLGHAQHWFKMEAEMVIIKEKVAGKEAIEALVRLIATRASLDEAVLFQNLGDGLKVDATGKVNVDINGLDFDVGDFYIDDDGHLIWDRDANSGDGYMVVKKGEEIVYASDDDIQHIIDGVGDILGD